MVMGPAASGSAMHDPSGRRASAFASRRKTSVVVNEAPAAIVEASALNADDRRLAQMGYVQVSRMTYCPANRATPTNHPRRLLGLQARILLAVYRLLRPLHLRPLRQRFHDLRIPLRGWRCFLGRMVLARFRLRMLLHCLVSRRARLCLSHLRRPILYNQISRTNQLGARARLVDGLAQPSGTDCWSGVDRVWLCPIAAGCCFNGR